MFDIASDFKRRPDCPWENDFSTFISGLFYYITLEERLTPKMKREIEEMDDSLL